MAHTAPAPPALVETLKWQSGWSPDNAAIHVARHRNHGHTEMHDHVFREIVFVETGTADHATADGSIQRLRPGDLVVIRPLVRHAYVNPRNFGIINCLFDRRMMQRLTPLLSDVDGAFDLYRRPARRARDEVPVVLHVRPAHRPTLLERFERIMAEEQSRSSGWQAAAAAALLDILVTTARLRRGQGAVAAPPVARRIDQAVLDAVTWLEASYAQPVVLEDLARRVGVSAAHLSRSFGQRMGIGIIEFMHQLRCEEACRLLRCTDEPVGHIAAQVGYSEIAYFSRRFRRQTGQSPRQYARSTPR